MQDDFNFWPFGGRNIVPSEKKKENKNEKNEKKDKRATFFRPHHDENKRDFHPGPWHQCAVTIMCIFTFRDGPWHGMLDKNIVQKIGRLVYSAVCGFDGDLGFTLPDRRGYSSDYDGRMRGSYKGYNGWEHRLGGDGFFGLCYVCHRPFKTQKGCWLHPGSNKRS